MSASRPRGTRTWHAGELDERSGRPSARYAGAEQETRPRPAARPRAPRDVIVIDTQWKDHLLSIDHLKEGIGLRGYGQRDPLTEYKKEAFDLFEDMFERMKAAVIERLFKVQIVRDAPMELPAMTAWADARESRGEIAGEPARASTPAPRAQSVPRTPTGEKIGRNDPCYCGSGKKYKKCHYLKS
jgi:preprotein translocase subunit SecA